MKETLFWIGQMLCVLTIFGLVYWCYVMMPIHSITVMQNGVKIEILYNAQFQEVGRLEKK